VAYLKEQRTAVRNEVTEFTRVRDVLTARSEPRDRFDPAVQRTPVRRHADWGQSWGAPYSLAYVGDPTPATDANIENRLGRHRFTYQRSRLAIAKAVQIRRLDNLVAIKWSDRDRRYINVWDDRATYTYV